MLLSILSQMISDFNVNGRSLFITNSAKENTALNIKPQPLDWSHPFFTYVKCFRHILFFVIFIFLCISNCFITKCDYSCNSSQYFNDILHCLLRSFTFQSHSQHKWAMQNSKIIVQEEVTVLHYAGNCITILLQTVLLSVTYEKSFYHILTV